MSRASRIFEWNVKDSSLIQVLDAVCRNEKMETSISPRVSGGKNQEIEVLRAFAIVLTLWHHFRYWVFPWEVQGPFFFKEAWTGVSLFFVVSGFLVTRSLMKTFEPGLKRLESGPDPLISSLKAFYVRRAFRIFPLAYSTLLLGLAVQLFFPYYYKNPDLYEVLGNAFAAGTFSINYKMAYDGSLAFVWYWSLCVEEHFYLLLPLFLFYVRAPARRILFCWAFIFSTTFLLRPLSGRLEFPYLRFVSHLNFDFILSGCLLYFLTTQAWFSQLAPSFLKKRPTTVLFLNLVLFLVIWIAPNALGPLTKFPIVLGASAALVFLGAHQQGFISSRLTGSDLLKWLSSRSYSLYLIHPIVYQINLAIWKEVARHQAFSLESALPVLGIVLSALSFTCIFSEASYRWFEVPLTEKGRKISQDLLARNPPFWESVSRAA